MRFNVETKSKESHKIFTAKREKSTINMEATGNRRLQSYFQCPVVTLIIGFSDTIFYVTNLLDILMCGIPLLSKVGITFFSASHLPFAICFNAVRVNNQEFSLEMSQSQSYFTQGNLK